MIINLPKYYLKYAIVTYFLVLLSVMIMNIQGVMPVIWICISSITFISFFYFLKNLPISWHKYSDSYFRKKLFKTALIIRVVVVVFMYFLFEVLNSRPFEFDAGDSLFYHNLATQMSDKALNLDSRFYTDITSFIAFSDRGYPVFLTFLYCLFFKSILLTRIVHAIFGAWSCVIIYDFTKRNFNEPTARLAGIIMLLLPNLIYYCGLHLKETIMTFLTILSINYADIIFKEQKLKLSNILILALCIFSLFTLRTLLAVAVLFSFFFSVVITKKMGTKTRKIIVFVIILAFGGIIFASFLKDDINFYRNGVKGNQQAQLQHFATRQNGNKLAVYGSKAIFAPLILTAPFPTLTDTHQDNQMMSSGAVFTHNIYSFFIIMSFFLIIKRGLWRKYSLIIAFVTSYIVILIFSAFVLSERFHLPSLPFLAILAAYGMYELNNHERKYIKYYAIFLFFISCVIIGWNWFKLAGRDMI
jgi:hypothetical protein